MKRNPFNKSIVKLKKVNINSNIKLTLGLVMVMAALLFLNYQFSFSKNYPSSGVWYASNTNKEIPSHYISITECNENTIIEVTETIINTSTKSKQIIGIPNLSRILIHF